MHAGIKINPVTALRHWAINWTSDCHLPVELLGRKLKWESSFKMYTYADNNNIQLKHRPQDGVHVAQTSMCLLPL